MTESPGRAPLVLCSGSLGSASLEEKMAAAAEAGFTWVSIYGHEYHAAVQSGVDIATRLRQLGLRVAEVDGVAITLSDQALVGDALEIAADTSARSITIVETKAFDPADATQMNNTIEAFGAACDLAADDGVLVHIEPFAWSDLASAAIAARIVTEAARPNGGLLLDLWHHVRGPDHGVLNPEIPNSMLLSLQLADTLTEAWPNVRDECMQQRLLPGEGAADLAGKLANLAARGPLPPIGIEVFGEALAGFSPLDAAKKARASLEATLHAANL